jgi:hypothetical protein
MPEDEPPKLERLQWHCTCWTTACDSCQKICDTPCTIWGKTYPPCPIPWELIQHTPTNRCSDSRFIYIAQHTLLLLWIQSLWRKHIVSLCHCTNWYLKLSRANVLPIPAILCQSSRHTLVREYAITDSSGREKQYPHLAYWLEFWYIPDIPSMDSTDCTTWSDGACCWLHIVYSFTW